MARDQDSKLKGSKELRRGLRDGEEKICRRRSGKKAPLGERWWCVGSGVRAVEAAGEVISFDFLNLVFWGTGFWGIIELGFFWIDFLCFIWCEWCGRMGDQNLAGIWSGSDGLGWCIVAA